MAQDTAERHVWTVGMLDVDPTDYLLEIGCGHGLAVSLICQKLEEGKIVAIDRSEAMIRAATKRNQQHVAAGKAEFHIAGLATLDLNGKRFNKIFCVNVNLFWTKPAGQELAVIKNLLTPGGVFYLMYAGKPPVASRTQQLADTLPDILRENGYSINNVEIEKTSDVQGLCIMAERA